MKIDLFFVTPIILLIVFSLIVLNSISPSVFPSYYIYIVLGVIFYLTFSLLGFEIVSVFAKYLYVISILLLVITLIIGQVTRGTVRWIPIGSFSIQPSEIVRPFLLIYFANYISEKRLTIKRLFSAVLLMFIPLLLILVQPSLGVTALTAIGFLGIFLASEINKKNIFILFAIFLVSLPIVFFALKPYQRDRITAFLDPSKDPQGVGYNAIQSTISVGSGKLLGRGLGRGVGTQLSFLPERHTDFVFASISEEMGFIGSIVLMTLTFLILFRVVGYIENPINIPARLFLSGFLLTYFAQVFVHVGMNMGLLPITGIPFPLVSAGGSSLISTMIGLGIVSSSKNRV